jgi:hypothetical protein
MIATRWLVVCVTQVLVIGCTSPSNDATNTAPPRGPLLDPKAARELETLGYRKYEGTAVISDEVPSKRAGAPAKVSFDPASGPLCLGGTPYSVWYLDRQSDDLILMLDGGGACWSGLCNANEQVPEYFVSDTAAAVAFPDAPTADSIVQTPDDPGVTPIKNFSSWNAVSFPYCDGSVFMGENDAPIPGTEFMNYFHGQQNLAAGLDVAVAHFPNPKRILLEGWSAGGYGTITAMIATRLRYPDAELYVLDDSGPGLVNLEETTDIQERLDEWNYAELFPESCEECAGGRGQFAPLFDWMLERDQGIRIGVASHYQDGTISSFLRMPPTSYEPLLHDTLQPIFDAHPDRFKRFMLPGEDHVLTSTDSRFVATAGGVRIDEWTVAMTNRDEATWVDIQADCAYTCCHPDQPSCEADPGCTGVFGRDAPDHSDTFAGCIPTPSDCDHHVTCALVDSSATCFQFPDGCIPSGSLVVPCGSEACPALPSE